MQKLQEAGQADTGMAGRENGCAVNHVRVCQQ